MKVMRTQYRPDRNLFWGRSISTFFLLSCVVLLLAPSSLADDKKPPAKKFRVRLEETESANRGSTGNVKAPQRALSRVEVSVEIERTAKLDNSRGIEFSLDFLNTSAAEVVDLLDPSDYVIVVVLNEQGWPVSMPPAPPKALINTSDVPQPIPNETERPFEVVRPASQESNQAGEKVGRKSVRLAPGEGHRVTLRVKRVLAKPEEYAARVRQRKDRPPGSPVLGRPESVAIGPGKYKVQVWVGLRSATGDSRKVVQSGWIPLELEE